MALGEKGITGKNTLWDNGTQVPLIFAGPGITSGQLCRTPAELLDIYPTLVDLCQLPPRDDLEGISLVPQLRDASTARQRPRLRATIKAITGYAANDGVIYDTPMDRRNCMTCRVIRTSGTIWRLVLNMLR